MKKKILIAYPEMMLGGSTTSLLSLLNTIDENSFEVDLILYKNRGDYLSDIPSHINLLGEASLYKGNSLKNKIMKILHLILTGYFFKAFSYEFFRKGRIGLNTQIFAFAQAGISRQLEKEYDVAIGFLELWSNAFVVNKVKASKKITWIHVDYAKAGYIPQIDNSMLNESDHIACVSEECLVNFRRDFPNLAHKAIYLENILSSKYVISKANESHPPLIEYEGLKILTVCRLAIYHKGLDRILLAMKRLIDEGFEIKWYIVGEGKDREEFEELIKEYQLEKSVILIGKKINPYPYFKKCDAYVMASRYEGKPMAVTEAQILGLPPIITNYASAPEQVEHDVDGIIVNNDDSSIYEGIKKVLKNGELLNFYKKNLGKKALSNEHKIQDLYSIIE